MLCVIKLSLGGPCLSPRRPMSPRSTSSPQAHLSQQQIQGSGHFNRGVKHRMTVSKSKPGAWALTLLLVLQEAEQELDGEEGSPQAGPEEEDGE